jgi:hypothetical protein
LPSWARVRAEIDKAAKGPLPDGQSPHDVVRKRKLLALSKYLEKPVVTYAVDCLTPSPKSAVLGQLLGPAATMIEPGDKDAFAEVLEDIHGDELVVLLQSPGGYAETSEALVQQLRPRFKKVSFIVPMYAKSAATMFALSGEVLYLDEHSELGPIDPQFNFPNRGVASPAGGILGQFEQAVDEIKRDPERLPAWAPILQQYAPSLLDDAREAWDLANEMVRGWLERYMFAGQPDAQARAQEIADYFSARTEGDKVRSHSRPIGIEKCKELGLEVVDLRSSGSLHKRVRDLHHAINITILETGAYKLLENHLGQTHVRSLNLEVTAVPDGAPRARSGGWRPPGPRSQRLHRRDGCAVDAVKWLRSRNFHRYCRVMPTTIVLTTGQTFIAEESIVEIGPHFGKPEPIKVTDVSGTRWVNGSYIVWMQEEH